MARVAERPTSSVKSALSSPASAAAACASSTRPASALRPLEAKAIIACMSLKA